MGRLCTRAAVVITTAAVVAGCSGTTPTVGEGPTADEGPALTSTSDDMVIEVSIGGGLVPPHARVTDTLPRIWIAGDGRYLRQTPDAPANQALATLQEWRIPEAALPGLIDAARTAGLLEDNPDYGKSRIVDAMVTRVVVVSGGFRHEVLVSALGYPNPGLDDAAMAARTRLSGFLDVLQQPERIAGVSGPTPYTPTELAVFVLGTADDSTPGTPAVWPLGDLGSAGAPVDWPTKTARCLVLSGDDVAAVTSAAAETTVVGPWRAGDGLWAVTLRPLLPDEHSCADVTG